VPLGQFGRVRLRVWNQVGAKPFDGEVFIYSSYESVAQILERMRKEYSSTRLNSDLSTP